MKALFVIDGLGSGGAQRQMVTLAVALQERGHEIEFFIYTAQYHFLEILENANIPVTLCEKKSKYSFFPIISLWNILRLGKFNVVLSFLETPSFYSEIACLPLSSVKLIVSERFMYPPGKLKFGRRLFQQMHRFADWITVNSHHQRKRMEAEFYWMSTKIMTIYNGYDLKKFSPHPINKENYNSLELLVLASVSTKKNSLNLAKAILICKERYKLRVNIRWAGSLSVSNEGERPFLETDSFLNNLGLTDQWRWLGVRSDVQQLLMECDALIHPSTFEGLPNAICEALACGRPVLASRVCDHPTLIKDGYSGFLFNPESTDDIANMIWKFSKLQPQERSVMQENARHYAENNLSLSRYVSEYEKIMKTLSSR